MFRKPRWSQFVTTSATYETLRILLYAFMEKGMYMLATILRSSMSPETTFAIIETFIKLRQLADDAAASDERNE